MKITYPHIIENGQGEKLVFRELIKEPDGDRLVGQIFVAPGIGPLMHVHFLQDEGFTVISGRIAYQIEGQPVQYAGKGDTITFERGVPHRFWNDGSEVLKCNCWIKPANTFPFFITSIFNAQKKSGKERPDQFDAAYLLTRYSTEYDFTAMPKFVRKVIVPTTYLIGKILGKYKHFKDAPDPIKN